MKKSILATMAGVAVLSAATAAMAAAPVITDISGGGTTAPNNPYQVKYIAYEMYNNITGVNSNNVEFFARLGGDVSKGDSVNIKGYNADVNLGSGNLFLLGMTDNIAINNASLGAWTIAANNHPITAGGALALTGRASGATMSLLAGGLCNLAVTGFNAPTALPVTNYVVIGDSNATGVQNQVTMLGADLGTFCRLNTGDVTIGAGATGAGLTSTDKVMALTPTGSNTWISTAQGTLSNVAGTDVGRVIPSVTFGLNLYVKDNLNPSCTVPKDIQLHLVTNQETINPTTVLQIIPQFVATAGSTAMQQELSTNDDFKQFIDSSNTIYAQYNRSLGYGGSLYSLLDRHFTVSLANAYQGMFRSFVPQTASASLDFTLTSLSSQAGVGMSYYNWVPAAVACTKDAATNKVFTCSTGTGTTLQLTTPGVAAANGAAGTSNALNVSNGAATVEMVPTSWSTTAFTFKINGVTDTCVSALGSVGNWYGGIEAIVPFVKVDGAAGYQTYIKLFNRYTKAAKLYVANMNQISDSIVTSITQLPAPNDQIGIKSFVTISGDDLINNSIITAAEGQSGTPIKFLIRVPAQAGSPAFTTLTDNAVPILGGGSLTAVGSAAGVATASVVDPYINGVVIQLVPGGSQRSISLMFKSFKQGQYNVN
ncbi:MAG: hypothetical protein WC007_13250 [Pelobacteraceae bacterium]